MIHRGLLTISCLFGLFILGLDLFTKYWVQAHIPLVDWQTSYPYDGIGVFRDFFGIEFSIVHVTNHGVAWGALGEYQLPLVILRICLIFGMAIYLLHYNRRRSWVFPLTLVLFGAIGNVIDYFIYGKVIDMFYFVLWGYRYPVFNVADSAVTVGVLWIVFITPFFEKKLQTSE